MTDGERANQPENLSLLRNDYVGRHRGGHRRCCAAGTLTQASWFISADLHWIDRRRTGAIRWMGHTRIHLKMPVLLRTAAALAASCGVVPPRTADCGDHAPIPAEAIPEPRSFSLVSTSEVEPVGCGDDWGRTAVLSAEAREPLAAFADALLAEGHSEVECNTKAERCFDVGAYFVAATEPRPDAPPYFPSPVGSRPQVLLSIGEAFQP